MIAHTLVGPRLQIFFTDHLVAQRRLSLQTVASYRNTFRLLLQFVHRETGIEPVALKIAGLDAEIILRFLDALEKDRGNTVVLATCGSRRYARSIAWSHCVILRASGRQRTPQIIELQPPGRICTARPIEAQSCWAACKFCSTACWSVTSSVGLSAIDGPRGQACIGSA
jgi:hypothetical protein